MYVYAPLPLVWWLSCSKRMPESRLGWSGHCKCCLLVTHDHAFFFFSLSPSFLFSFLFYFLLKQLNISFRLRSVRPVSEIPPFLSSSPLEVIKKCSLLRKSSFPYTQGWVWEQYCISAGKGNEEKELGRRRKMEGNRWHAVLFSGKN